MIILKTVNEHDQIVKHTFCVTGRKTEENWKNKAEIMLAKIPGEESTEDVIPRKILKVYYNEISSHVHRFLRKRFPWKPGSKQVSVKPNNRREYTTIERKALIKRTKRDSKF